MARGLAKGLTVPEAGIKAGYSEQFSNTGLYKVVKRPRVQSLFTDACERLMAERGIGMLEVIRPYFDGLTAPLIVKSTQLGDAYMPIEPKSQLPYPDHGIRMDAADRIVNLFGGKPREVDMPAEAAKGLVVIIAKDGVSAEKAAVDITPKATIEARGEGSNPVVPVKIMKQGAS